MAKLTTAQRKAMPKSDFGLPGKKAYPMPDASHAANAKARASQAVNAGRMSPATEKKIDAKADRVMGKNPERGQRTETHKATRHPQSHAEWENMGKD
ncbi:hypothetical protein [Burkholderia cenocepacia]|uniref:hypothetical protein n=1 Tax=Burkholderia cenocepacia TaxID=95486 RepID=UPI002B255DB3|nr:hypothetical protein [Burkholderia cenocepacia]MEB2554061.1 hypothetical protein [Burkholderia cenocepacia]